MRSITNTLAMDSLNAPDEFPLDPASYPLVPPRYHTSLPIPFHQSSFLSIPANPSMDLQFILSPVEGWSSQPSRNSVTPPVAPRYTRPKVHGAPKHVHPNPDDAIVSFDSTTRTFVKPSKPSKPPAADPYAEDFLRDVLGHDKWETFSSRLFERRLGTKPKGKGKGKPEEDDVKSVSAIEFLVKVEVVKEILRTYVPHPYNPLKSLTHSYKGAPSGQVTLTRSTVLALSGWSNTQFSYWARRAEAVSVLAEHDPRLRAVGNILERHLRGNTITENDETQDEATSVTGKGLDLIVDEVKKRTGKSQFLRGKHSSLDPYGTAITESEPAAQIPPPALFAMPTFQAERYSHYTARFMKKNTPSLRLNSPASPPSGPKHTLLSQPSSTPDSFDSQAESEEPTTPSVVSSPSISSDRALSPEPSDSSTPPRDVHPSLHKSNIIFDSSTPHFPVSDSRSEFENYNAGGKRKTRASTAVVQKRARTLLTDCED